MQKFSKSLPNAIPAAILTAVVWYFINEFARVKGVGLLERQSWPANNMYLCIAIAAIFAVGCSFAYLYLVEQRVAGLRNAAAELGLGFRDQIGKSTLGRSLSLRIFDDWKKGENLIHGDFDGHPVQVFDLTKEYTTTSRDASTSRTQTHTTTERQTMFLIPLDEPPRTAFQILRNNAVSWSVRALGFEGIQFSTDDHFASADDRDAMKRFNDTWLVVRGLRRKGNTGGAEGDEGAEIVLRQMEKTIGLPLLKLLLSDDRWCLEQCETHVAIWMHKTHVKPGQLNECLRSVFTLAEQLQRPPSGAQERLIASGQTQVQLETSVSRILPIAVSGCLGMVLAFGSFLPIFFWLVDDAPWLVLAWPFFGMAIVAGSVFVGTRLANKWRKAREGSELRSLE